MQSPFAVDGKVILITGAARGIGATCAQMLAEAGAKVMLTDILVELGQQTTDEICKNGGTAKFMPLDVTSEAAWDDVIDTTVKTFGGLDVLVNNAGIEIIKPLFQTSLEEFKTLQAVKDKGGRYQITFSIDSQRLFLGLKKKRSRQRRFHYQHVIDCRPGWLRRFHLLLRNQRRSQTLQQKRCG